MIFVPSMNSVVNTCRDDRSGTTVGKRTVGSPAKLRATTSMLRASFVKSNSSAII